MQVTLSSIKEFFQNSNGVFDFYEGEDGFYLLNGLTGEILEIAFPSKFDMLDFMDDYCNSQILKKYGREWLHS